MSLAESMSMQGSILEQYIPEFMRDSIKRDNLRSSDHSDDEQPPSGLFALLEHLSNNNARIKFG